MAYGGSFGCYNRLFRPVPLFLTSNGKYSYNRIVFPVMHKHITRRVERTHLDGIMYEPLISKIHSRDAVNFNQRRGIISEFIPVTFSARDNRLKGGLTRRLRNKRHACYRELSRRNLLSRKVDPYNINPWEVYRSSRDRAVRVNCAGRGFDSGSAFLPALIFLPFSATPRVSVERRTSVKRRTSVPQRRCNRAV